MVDYNEFIKYHKKKRSICTEEEHEDVLNKLDTIRDAIFSEKCMRNSENGLNWDKNFKYSELREFKRMQCRTSYEFKMEDLKAMYSFLNKDQINNKDINELNSFNIIDKLYESAYNNLKINEKIKEKRALESSNHDNYNTNILEYYDIDLVDKIFLKIKNEKLKKIDNDILIYVLSRSENYNDLKFLLKKLTDLKVYINRNLKNHIFYLIEDYDDALEIFNYMLSTIDLRKSKRSREFDKITLYTHMIRLAYTENQIDGIMNKFNSENIQNAISLYVELLEKQKTYHDAKQILNKYILSNKEIRMRINNWKICNNDDSLKEIYPLMFIKAINKDEVKEITGQLKSINMSCNIDDYNYLKIKSSTRYASEKRNALREYLKYKPVAYKLKKILNLSHAQEMCTKANEDIGNVVKNNRSVNIYERNQKLVRCLKNKYNNLCQICGECLNLGNEYYSEVHHIYPLYLGGPDIAENMIVLCPNHHVLFDKGALKLNLDMKEVIYMDGKISKMHNLKHEISKNFIEYHNKNIFSRNDIDRVRYNKEKLTVQYNSNVILQKCNTNEEVSFKIPSKDKISFAMFKALNHKIGDTIKINNEIYRILNIT